MDKSPGVAVDLEFKLVLFGIDVWRAWGTHVVPVEHTDSVGLRHCIDGVLVLAHEAKELVFVKAVGDASGQKRREFPLAAEEDVGNSEHAGVIWQPLHREESLNHFARLNRVFQIAPVGAVPPARLPIVLCESDYFRVRVEVAVFRVCFLELVLELHGGLPQVLNLSLEGQHARHKAIPQRFGVRK